MARPIKEIVRPIWEAVKTDTPMRWDDEDGARIDAVTDALGRMRMKGRWEKRLMRTPGIDRKVLEFDRDQLKELQMEEFGWVVPEHNPDVARRRREARQRRERARQLREQAEWQREYDGWASRQNRYYAWLDAQKLEERVVSPRRGPTPPLDTAPISPVASPSPPSRRDSARRTPRADTSSGSDDDDEGRRERARFLEVLRRNSAHLLARTVRSETQDAIQLALDRLDGQAPTPEQEAYLDELREVSDAMRNELQTFVNCFESAYTVDVNDAFMWLTARTIELWRGPRRTGIGVLRPRCTRPVEHLQDEAEFAREKNRWTTKRLEDLFPEPQQDDDVVPPTPDDVRLRREEEEEEARRQKRARRREHERMFSKIVRSTAAYDEGRQLHARTRGLLSEVRAYLGDRTPNRKQRECLTALLHVESSVTEELARFEDCFEAAYTIPHGQNPDRDRSREIALWSTPQRIGYGRRRARCPQPVTALQRAVQVLRDRLQAAVRTDCFASSVSVKGLPTTRASPGRVRRGRGVHLTRA